MRGVRRTSLATVLAVGAAITSLAFLRPEAEVRVSAASTYDAEGRLTRPVGARERLPNFVVILVDTLRADALAEPRDERSPGLMPHLRDLAATGVSFSNACASSPWTLPSATSLLTGLLPSAHGACDSRRAPWLAAGVTTFAEALGNGFGYETAALANAPFLGGTILQGFRYVDEDFTLQSTPEAVSSWTAHRDPGRPFLLLLHTYDVHDPYGPENHALEPAPPDLAAVGRDLDDPSHVLRTFFLDRPVREGYLARFGQAFTRAALRAMNDACPEKGMADVKRDLRSAYEEGVRWTDGLLARSVRFLEEAGLLENTVLVVTGDHGEAFCEHGIFGHGRQMYDELVRVPLVIRGPAPFRGGRVIPSSVGLIDLFPTLFEFAGLPLPEGITGRSFLRRIDRPDAGWPVVSQDVLSVDNTGHAIEALRTAVRNARWKYVLTCDRITGEAVQELYDLATDPGEVLNLLAVPEAEFLALDEDFCRAVAEARERMRLVSAVRRARPRPPDPTAASPDPLPPGPCE